MNRLKKERGPEDPDSKELNSAHEKQCGTNIGRNPYSRTFGFALGLITAL